MARPRVNELRPGESRQAASIRAKREHWRTAGLCPVCGDAKEQGRSKCRPCLDRAARWASAQPGTAPATPTA